jgi:hypothetical protein
MGRADLIGNGKQHLIPIFQPKGTGEGTLSLTFKTQQTGLKTLRDSKNKGYSRSAVKHKR